MLEAQLEQVKSEEWNELLKPFSSYVSDSHTVIKEVLAGELDSSNDVVVETTLTEEPTTVDEPTLEQAAMDPKAMLDLLNKDPK